MSKTMGIGGPLIAGRFHIGDRGGGVLGSSVPATGTDGPGFGYAALILPADANKEFMARILSMTAGLSFAPAEDTSGLATAPDGTYTITYQPYFDYVARGAPLTDTIIFGSGTPVTGAAAWTEGPETYAASGVIGSAVVATSSWSEGPETYALEAGAYQPVSAAAAWTEGPETYAVTCVVGVRFVVGNSEVFMVSARGTMWRPPAR
jgi:hypothetical protein